MRALFTLLVVGGVAYVAYRTGLFAKLYRLALPASDDGAVRPQPVQRQPASPTPPTEASGGATWQPPSTGELRSPLSAGRVMLPAPQRGGHGHR